MNSHMHGFTLLELMVVVVIAAVLLGFGVPTMGNFIRNGRITAAANDVMASLHYARSEAIKRRLPVTLCTSANALAAAPTCAASALLTGSIVFVDNNGNGQRDSASFNDLDLDGFQDSNEDANGNGLLDAGEDLDGDGHLDVAEPNVGAELVLLQHAPLPATITARGSASPLRITYLDTGFAQNANAAQLVLCDSRGNVPAAGELSAARGILISPTGRAGVTRVRSEIQTLISQIGTTIGGCAP